MKDKEKLFNIGDTVTSVFGTEEGVIIAYTLRPASFKQRHMYKVKWKGWFKKAEWVVQSCISKIIYK